ncbi:toxin-antitoxin system HicB family antitoxin [Brachybacterium sp. YJGR34]|uniref:toxin-antitoxin system HicB family antitoxin n=1 Tax=Brachybacterium sp. YJGR34 TaxID=2059911 RepID=UPI000E0AA331|nr:toxin-antitoxin system HicB family antitoxin [Brachybacterium sp. YJGR34]
MEMTRYVDELQRQLSLAAAAGGQDAVELAGRLTAPLDAAARLVLLEALSDAAGEISAEIAPAAVDLRLRGGEAEFVVAGPPTPTPAPAPPAPPVVGEQGPATRTTLRLPDHLKSQAETAAAREGVSVNTWLVRAVASALGEQAAPPAARSDAGRRVTGWVR